MSAGATTTYHTVYRYLITLLRVDKQGMAVDYEYLTGDRIQVVHAYILVIAFSKLL